MTTKDSSVVMTPGEVAAMFRVDPKTVTRWANTGSLASFKTLGGHRRFLRKDVEALWKKDSRESTRHVPR